MNQLYYGVAYYPELWKDKIDEDIKMMKEAGINLVRIGEFAWSDLEPEEGKYDFAWLEEVLDKLDKADISYIMCTPTATPPIWVTEKYPEVLYVDKDGVRHVHGSRQHVCVNSEKYKEITRKIVEEISKRVGKRKGLKGWQIDNEFLCHRQECYCKSCEDSFHKWLKEKYHDTETLNKIWGTGIWSERYQKFEQIPLPKRTPFLHHCSLRTDYKRFTSDSYVKYAEMQANIIRKYSKAEISHNTMPPHHLLDSEKLFQVLDVPGCDGYNSNDRFELMLREFDWLKSIRDDRKFWWLETSPNYNGNIKKSHRPLPKGFLKIESSVAYWLGAEVFNYWLWRGQRSGSEMVHGSVIYPWGKPTTGYDDVKEAAEYLKYLSKIIRETKPVKGEIGLHFSYEAKYMLETEPMMDGYNYVERWIEDIYKPIIRRGIYRDIIFEEKDVNSYKIIITPYLPAMKEEFLRKMYKYAEKGGIWIVGPMSGYNTEYHTRNIDKCLGKLEEIAGIEVIYSLPGDKLETKGIYNNKEVNIRWWLYGVKIDKDVVGKGIYTKDEKLEGLYFLTERKIGKGKIVFIGGTLDEDIYGEIIENYCQEAGVKRIYKVSKGSIVIPRENDEGEEWLLIANWDGKGGYFYKFNYKINPFEITILKNKKNK